MFKLNLVTPEKKLVSNQEIDEVTLPAFRGELNILPGHSPLMTTLEPGILKYKLKGASEQVRVAISWGYCQVSTDAVNVLAEGAVTKEEIEIKKVNEHLKTQEQRLSSETLDDESWQHVQHEVARLNAEVELSQGKPS